MKTLVISSHSYSAQSVSNTAIREVLAATPGVTVRHIESLYPDYRIDVAAEQAALVEADVVVFLHPMFWFNVPAGLKHYMDEVLQYGFAYGTDGDKLKGKKFLHVLTTGSGADTYDTGLIDALATPIKVSAGFCGMDYVGLLPCYGQLALTNANAAEDAKAFAAKVVEKIQSLG